MRRKNILRGLLCAAVLLGAALVGAQEVSARETVLIAGNADLYPIESYDSRSDSYVGLLPELYRRVSGCTDYDLVYLPYSKNTTQAQQAENRQADIISAFPAGTVDSAYLRRSELFCSLPASGKPQNICIGFASALPEAQAEEIARALDGIGAAERLGILAVSVKDGGASLYRTRWLVTLAALGVMMLGAGGALGVLVRKKRTELKANALIDPHYSASKAEYGVFFCLFAFPFPFSMRLVYPCIKQRSERGQAACDYLARITRNLALDRYNYNPAAQRSTALTDAFEELEPWIVAGQGDPDTELDASELRRVLNGFLRRQSAEARVFFLRRYWYGESIREIAEECCVSEAKVKTSLFRTRERLRAELEQERITL